jgi:hypothetical protein
MSKEVEKGSMDELYQSCVKDDNRIVLMPKVVSRGKYIAKSAFRANSHLDNNNVPLSLI